MARADLLEAWHAHLAHGRRRSPHTVRAYVATAARLLDGRPGAEWSDLANLDGPALRQHLATRRAEGLANISAARELSALKAFLAFARAQAGVAESQAPRVRAPRVKKGIPRPVTPDDAVNLAAMVHEEASEEWIGARDRAVLLLLYACGLRISEALALTRTPTLRAPASLALVARLARRRRGGAGSGSAWTWCIGGKGWPV